MTKELLNCPFCGGALGLYLYDETMSRFCDGYPCWDGGASCEQCGVGISVGCFGGGIDVETVEKMIIRTINRRSPKSD